MFFGIFVSITVHSAFEAFKKHAYKQAIQEMREITK